MILWFLIGDEFALREGGSLYCKDDHDVLEKSIQIDSNPAEHNNNNAMINNNNTINSNSQTSILSNNNLTSELGSVSGKGNIFFFLRFFKTCSIIN